MTPSNDLPLSNDKAPRSLDSHEMIERLATELRARSGGELPHAFYVEQVRKQLAGKAPETGAANDVPGWKKPADQKPAEHTSVFHSWAISE